MAKPYKEFYFDGTKVKCFDETSGFTLAINDDEYYVNYNETEATIEIVNEGEKEHYDTIAIDNLPDGECIQEKVARYILLEQQPQNMKQISRTERMVTMSDGAQKWGFIYENAENDDTDYALIDGWYIPVISNDGGNTYRVNGGDWIEA